MKKLRQPCLTRAEGRAGLSRGDEGGCHSRCRTIAHTCIPLGNGSSAIGCRSDDPFGICTVYRHAGRVGHWRPAGRRCCCNPRLSIGGGTRVLAASRQNAGNKKKRKASPSKPSNPSNLSATFRLVRTSHEQHPDPSSQPFIITIPQRLCRNGGLDAMTCYWKQWLLLLSCGAGQVHGEDVGRCTSTPLIR